jgi:hypothetical protein
MKSLGQRVSANVRAIERYIANRRVRGDSLVVAVTLRLPTALVRRAYSKFAQFFNGRVLGNLLNGRRLRRFHADVVSASGGHFYVIVMPGTLHFLMQCLALIPRRIKVVLLANGAAAWERRALQHAHPELALFTLRTLPSSSVPHGDVITLLLRNNHAPFGILDHDLYVFDQSVYDQLSFRPNEFALALFWGRGRGVPYPHTFFLYFDPQPIQRVMQRFRIDARIYRRAPSSLRRRLGELEFGRSHVTKEYLDYFDTLQLLFVAAQAAGLQWRVITGKENRGSVHVGSTSFSARGTKDAEQLYIHLKFLEISAADIRRRYAPLVAPFRAAAEVRPRLCESDRGRRLVQGVDALIKQLSVSDASTDAPMGGA